MLVCFFVDVTGGQCSQASDCEEGHTCAGAYESNKVTIGANDEDYHIWAEKIGLCIEPGNTILNLQSRI